ncbi:MAG TPA: glycosyltransferase 87 family protein [Candidatus Dormibacteraeota bacterium]|nr:glycosyltransferase 87 family protein [Candidatus Dormibacteraeota bacterium]
MIVLAPGILGSHAVIYSDAARAWLTGADPWQVGPPLAIFAGPPTMLLPFAPFAFLPHEFTRFGWVGIDLAISIWAIRRLGLPAYWLAFPPLFEAIVLGHPEVLVLGLLVVGRDAKARFAAPMAGLAVLVKPYAALPLLAERRMTALVVAAAATAATILFLPWARFLDELPGIGANLARQNVGDSTYGAPLLMAIAVIALAALGPRRALWLAVPVLWPYAQPIYKVMSIPVMPAVLAVLWALPVPGLTLASVVGLAVLTLIERRRALPPWLERGIRPASKAFERSGGTPAPGATGIAATAMKTSLA